MRLIWELRDQQEALGTEEVGTQGHGLKSKEQHAKESGLEATTFFQGRRQERG